MFAVPAEAAVERGEGEIRGEEEAKAEGAGAKGTGEGPERVETARVVRENPSARFSQSHSGCRCESRRIVVARIPVCSVKN